MCVVLIDVLSERRALTTVGDLLTAATGDDAKVRRAAMVALSQLASANHLPGMFKAVLKAEKGTEREAAEKAVAVAAGGVDFHQMRMFDAAQSANFPRKALFRFVAGPHQFFQGDLATK
jgi:hypothetical protein